MEDEKYNLKRNKTRKIYFITSESRFRWSWFVKENEARNGTEHKPKKQNKLEYVFRKQLKKDRRHCSAYNIPLLVVNISCDICNFGAWLSGDLITLYYK